jgi:transposase-like protein
MANCPKCHGEGCVKDGIVNGRQRYRCKACGYRHTVAERGAGAAVRRQALQLYLEGMGFRAIGRFLEVSHVAVYYWVKSFGKAVGSVRNTATEVKVVEMDELHSYVGHKKTTAGFGRLLIDMGDGSSVALWAPATWKQGGGSGQPLNGQESKQ